MAYKIEITPTALEALKAIADRRTRSAIIRRIDTLAEEPEKQGKPLRGWLAGFQSVRAAGQRYRVVYRVENARTTGARVHGWYTQGRQPQGYICLG